MNLSDFRHVVPFQNENDSKANEVRNWGPEFALFTPVKFRGGMSKILESVLRQT